MLVAVSALCVAVVAMSLYIGHTNQARRNSFATWLGPQEPFRSVFGSTDRVHDIENHPLLRSYDISLHVVLGGSLEIRESPNGVVGFDGRDIMEEKQLTVESDDTLLVGRIKLRTGERWKRFYSLDLRVRQGPLKGAVVHVRDGKIQNSVVDECVCIYFIPPGISIDEGPVAFDVCGWSAL
jgi:hypothetical protein